MLHSSDVTPGHLLPFAPRPDDPPGALEYRGLTWALAEYFTRLGDCPERAQALDLLAKALECAIAALRAQARRAS